MSPVAITLVVALAAIVGSDGTAEPRMKAVPKASSHGVAPIGEAEPAMKKAPAGMVVPVQRGTLGRKAGPAQHSPLVPKAGPAFGTARQGGLAATPVGNPGMVSSAECGSGFAKEIKPDHPTGFYECRLPASPACAAGFKHDDVFNVPNRFRYRCQEWTGSYGHCPQGWTESSAGISSYYCTSDQFRCKTGHQLGAVSRSGPTPSPGGGDGAALYKYRCNAL